jgi:hypothetical protein
MPSVTTSTVQAPTEAPARDVQVGSTMHSPTNDLAGKHSAVTSMVVECDEGTHVHHAKGNRGSHTHGDKGSRSMSGCGKGNLPTTTLQADHRHSLHDPDQATNGPKGKGARFASMTMSPQKPHTPISRGK